MNAAKSALTSAANDAANLSARTQGRRLLLAVADPLTPMTTVNAEATAEGRTISV